MNIKFKKKIPLKLVVFIALCTVLVTSIGVSTGIFSKSAFAGLSDSTSGFAWGGSESSSDGVMNGNETGLGWLSMNSTDCDTDHNGFIDTGACGGDNSTTVAYNYGVNIPPGDGQLSGYAWSPSFGWVSFNSTDLGGTNPCTPTLSPATRTGNNLSGGARILFIRDNTSSSAGLWDGCISLASSGAAFGGSVTYGVSIVNNNALSGYAWSSDLGWLDMSKVVYTPAIPIVTFSANPSTISTGQSSTLTWSSTGATSCTASGGFSTGGATSGSVSVSPLITSTYSVTCSGPGGTSVPANATVTVTVPDLTITATPNRVLVGGAITVTWSATNVNSCTITRNAASWKSVTAVASKVSGSSPDTITGQTVYVLSCMGSNGLAVATTANTTVNVSTPIKEY